MTGTVRMALTNPTSTPLQILGIEIIDSSGFAPQMDAPMDINYVKYISSAAWRHHPARVAELKASGMRCRICNASGSEVELQVHHRTYERLGAELPEDLTALCVDCHLGVTSMLRERNYVWRVPKRADIIRPLINPGHIPDPIHGAADGHRIRLFPLNWRPPFADAFGQTFRSIGSDRARPRQNHGQTSEDGR